MPGLGGHPGGVRLLFVFFFFLRLQFPASGAFAFACSDAIAAEEVDA